MGKSKIDRTGEEGYNNFGSKMVIIGYRTNKDIDVYFPEYDYIMKNQQYNNFKTGNIKCPYERRYYGVGYLGEGKYKVKENGKITRVYSTWNSMLRRCYDHKLHKKYPTYIGCTVCDEWLCFQNFAKWYYDNYYEIKGQKMALDKDILHKGNKIYSPDNCIFVPQTINSLFVKSDKTRGDYHIGVSYHKQHEKFQANCNIYDFKENKTKLKHLGYYNTPEKAFEIYKYYKEKNIKQIADYYKEQIPINLYNTLYRYEAEITD